MFEITNFPSSATLAETTESQAAEVMWAGRVISSKPQPQPHPQSVRCWLPYTCGVSLKCTRGDIRRTSLQLLKNQSLSGFLYPLYDGHVVANGLYLVRQSKQEIYEQTEQFLYDSSPDHFVKREDVERMVVEEVANSVELHFRLFDETLHQEIGATVVKQLILTSTSEQPLSILKSSRCCGHSDGGDDVMLFTTALAPGSPLSVIFSGDQEKWTAKVQANRCGLNCVWFVTPKFREINWRGRVGVTFKLVQGDGEASNEIEFFYCNESAHGILSLFGVKQYIYDPYKRDLLKKLDVGVNTEQDYAAQADKVMTQLRNVYTNARAAIFQFARAGSMISILQVHKCLLWETDTNGNTPIHLAVLFNQLESLEMLVNVAATLKSCPALLASLPIPTNVKDARSPQTRQRIGFIFYSG